MTAYSIPPDQADAIVRASAYHREDFDHAVIWFLPRTHSNVVTSLSSAFHEPTTSLGEFTRLPLELINEICLQLDILSLFKLRQVNNRARQVVNALLEYQIVTKHALNPLCALLRTRSASRVTLLDFYHLLCTQCCSICEDRYGDLVYLPTWIRCCSYCVQSGAPRLCVADIESIKGILRPSRKSLAELPTIKTLSGIYTMDERKRLKETIIVPTQSALLAYSEEHDGAEPTLEMIRKLQSYPIPAFVACCALPSYNPQTRQFENGLSCAGCQHASEADVGVYSEDRFCDTVYSRDGFLQHFVWCGEAQDLWLESDNGTIKPPNLSDICKNGGYFKRVQKD
jgi:hypothetical protein